MEKTNSAAKQTHKAETVTKTRKQKIPPKNTTDRKSWL